MSDDTAIEAAAQAILDFEDFREARLRRSRSQPAEEKHTRDTHQGYPGQTAFQVIDEHIDYESDPARWCRVAAAANRRAEQLRREKFTQQEE